MAMPHPCCGGSLQTGSQIVAIVEMIMSSLNLLMGIVGLAFFIFGVNDNPNTDFLAAVGAVNLCAIVLRFAVVLMSLALAVVLWMGANTRNASKCRIWLVGKGILILIEICFVGFMASESNNVEVLIINISNRVMGLSLDFYFFWIVYAFVTELRLREDSYGEGNNSGGKF